MHESDDAAVAEARNGDREAFRTLVERHSRYLFRIAFRLTRNTEDAQDVVQDTWLKAHAQLDRFESRSNVRTWLTRIAINCAIDHLRTSRRREPAYDPAAFDQEPASGWIETTDAEPDRLVLAGEIGARVDQTLTRLTALERAAFMRESRPIDQCHPPFRSVPSHVVRDSSCRGHSLFSLPYC